ncbi:MAG: DNA mismatch repair endonuclease MutL [Candidatus Abyssobacteria bacterium SURF_5]|uniref:DNA mismatch repair protein MutL n=1 Tax=Abyssobacteria bacterium (strain SURF_5) TaxID=2093360 RepID=A0A3A4N0E6_ABYX5|nr:MAG: DNA mismatch repair endonuclease MutL [Candidatus Abyssubacteria bacterium SURF_5]
MPTINILSEDTANKIAAGEIIERPSSVLKELVENSIDAGAKKISIELMGGGKTMIRVIDDGCGMSSDDALLCLERHATSKISSADDLYAIRTFGFRGEAIPSIAAVSKMEIITRAHDSISGTRIVIEGGVIHSVSEKGAPAGTQMTVRQLFFNTPARQKFMKSAATEYSHILNILQRQALAQPQINFRLVNGEREMLNLPPARTIADRLALVWGNDFLVHMKYGEAAHNDLSITAYLGTPALTRSNRDHQFFFLNRRPISNRLLTKALSDAYRGFVMSDRFPVAFIFIEIDPALVDVNIHPTKREVRFSDPNLISEQLLKTFSSAFGRGGAQRSEQSATISLPRPDDAAPRREEPLFQRIRIDDNFTAAPPEIEKDFPSAAAPVVPVTRPTADFSPVPTDARFVKQVFNAYLLCVQGEDLLIIDQHALHERMLYQELVERSGRMPALIQQMLIPLPIELPPDRAEILTAHLDLFAQIGIAIEPFGPRSFAVTALSFAHKEQRVVEIVRDGVDELYLGLKLKAPREILRRLMTISACKNSIKSGDPLSDSEAEMLLEGLKRIPQPATCLHGRPLVLRLTESQIARAFGRKG